MKKAEQVVLVIDDDPSMRTAIEELIEAANQNQERFHNLKVLCRNSAPSEP